MVGQGRRAHVSGIDKRPTTTITVRDPGDRLTGAGSGVPGDHLADRKHHGGTSQAVYVVAREQLDHWQAELGRDLAPGVFGENVTTGGLVVDDAVVGTTWHVGDHAQLEVRGPRIPCATFAAHLGEPGWVKRFTAHGHPGAYCAVLRPGTIRAGDGIRVHAVPGHGVTVRTVFSAYSGDLEAVDLVLRAGCLPAEEHAELEARVARRRADATPAAD